MLPGLVVALAYLIGSIPFSFLVVKLVAGISKEKATELNKHIKALNLKGVQSQVQGEQLRVTGKKRDDLQSVIAALKDHDFGIPLQFTNFRD